MTTSNSPVVSDLSAQAELSLTADVEQAVRDLAKYECYAQAWLTVCPTLAPFPTWHSTNHRWLGSMQVRDIYLRYVQYARGQMARNLVFDKAIPYAWRREMLCWLMSKPNRFIVSAYRSGSIVTGNMYRAYKGMIAYQPMLRA